jgi:hypothetical protein
MNTEIDKLFTSGISLMDLPSFHFWNIPFSFLDYQDDNYAVGYSLQYRAWSDSAYGQSNNHFLVPTV